MARLRNRFVSIIVHRMKFIAKQFWQLFLSIVFVPCVFCQCFMKLKSYVFIWFLWQHLALISLNKMSSKLNYRPWSRCLYHIDSHVEIIAKPIQNLWFFEKSVHTKRRATVDLLNRIKTIERISDIFPCAGECISIELESKGFNDHYE